jgi:hypothetical protein
LVQGEEQHREELYRQSEAKKKAKKARYQLCAVLYVSDKGLAALGVWAFILLYYEKMVSRNIWVYFRTLLQGSLSIEYCH